MNARISSISLFNIVIFCCEDFFIFARVESLILGKSVDDAIERALMYAEAGADGIMIHDYIKDPKNIFEL